MHKISSSYIKDINSSILSKGESNDCVVRALAASFDMTYDEAHNVAKIKFGRKDKNGVAGTIYTFHKLCNEKEKINNKSFTVLPKEQIRYEGSARYVSEKNPTKEPTQPILVRQLLEKFPTGTYFVFVKHHAFTLINGVIIGNFKDGKSMRAKVLNLVQIKG